ncbi:MAG: succinylglutamate desuccinylase/aspartoacylase family protein [Clostridiales bacterium]|nr:succinylglutamate desuccinylase/aspartoacylase family protein [Clostridiales bacterium]
MKRWIAALLLLFMFPVARAEDVPTGDGLRAADPIETIPWRTAGELCPALAWNDGTSARTYALGEPDLRLSVVALETGRDGPTVYVVAGAHGDEPAGILAAELLAAAGLASGRLYVLARANAWGCERRFRASEDGEDLNRAYPGSAEGGFSARASAAVFSNIASIRPDLVLDLHEAHSAAGEADFLGNTILSASLDGIEDAVLSLVEKSAAGGLCSAPFTLTGPPVPGSLAAEVTAKLGIPAATIETWREGDIGARVGDHLTIVAHFLAELEAQP